MYWHVAGNPRRWHVVHHPDVVVFSIIVVSIYVWRHKRNKQQ